MTKKPNNKASREIKLFRKSVLVGVFIFVLCVSIISIHAFHRKALVERMEHQQEQIVSVLKDIEQDRDQM